MNPRVLCGLDLQSQRPQPFQFVLSFRALHQHELFHFAVDYVASQREAILGKPCYLPARSLLRDPAAGYILLEEELANAHMIRAIRGGRKHTRVRARTHALRRFVESQPAGYVEGGNSTSTDVFERRSSELARKHVQCIAGYSPDFVDAVDSLEERGQISPIAWMVSSAG